MHVERIGFASLKGTRHLSRRQAELATDGPVGDRSYCLVDLAARRVLRSVENPTLVQAVVTRADDVLAVDLPGGTVADEVPRAGAAYTLDYWGRAADVELLEGPWSAAFSDHLGREVRLARPVRPAAIVYAGSVTLVTTGAMAVLAGTLGRPVHSARFRSTMLVATDDAGPTGDPGPTGHPGGAAHPEDAWHGGLLRVGEAVLRVTGPVPRCAVVDTDPVTGGRDARVLATLAGYRRSDGEIVFGVDAEIVTPGRVHAGDRVTWERN